MFTVALLTLNQQAYLATIIFAIAAGLLGSFVVVRRVALVGETLAHAILPGIVLGFIACYYLQLDRNPWVIFSCASLVGLLSMAIVHLIGRTTRIKPDTALGVVLAGFFGIGLAMVSSLRQHYDASASIESFIFGRIATISLEDVIAMTVVTTIMLLVLFVLLRPLLVLSFDKGFAFSLGYPIQFLDFLFYSMLTMTIVVSMQAMGVIMVSAMLITPAASAYLLTHKLSKMIGLAIGFAVAAAVIGCYLSININVGEYRNLPTGALITLIASLGFAITYIAAPRHGVVAKYLQQQRRKKRIRRENTLKAIYKLLEENGFRSDSVSLTQLCSQNNKHQLPVKKEINALTDNLLAVANDNMSKISLTSAGWKRATEIIRIHRLWELYLINQANYSSNHVHDDAEKIEHVVSPEIMAKLEQELNFPKLDPHGKPIPQEVVLERP